jgi:hypothetical protein
MVSKGNFKKIHFLAPSKDEQLRFGEIFDRILQLEQSLERFRLMSETFFASLQYRAFKGDLFQPSMPSVGFAP